MKTILFQGDSITDCGRVREENKNFFVRCYNTVKRKTLLGDGYPHLVAAEMGVGYKFINKGVGGDRIVDVYGRIVKDIINIKPDCMSLLVGVNDVWRAFDSDNGTGIKRFEKIYDIFLDEMQQELPDTKIIILGAFVLEGTATVNTPEQPDRYKQFRAGVEEVAAVTKALAEKYGHTYIDLQKIFDEAEKTVPAKDLLADGVHPTLKGHELIKNEWIKAYKAL